MGSVSQLSQVLSQHQFAWLAWLLREQETHKRKHYKGCSLNINVWYWKCKLVALCGNNLIISVTFTEQFLLQANTCSWFSLTVVSISKNKNKNKTIPGNKSAQIRPGLEYRIIEYLTRAMDIPCLECKEWRLFFCPAEYRECLPPIIYVYNIWV